MMKNVFNHGLYLFFSNNVSLGQTLFGPVVLWVGRGRAETEQITKSGANHKMEQSF